MTLILFCSFIFGVQPYFDSTQRNMEGDLNFLTQLDEICKTTYFFLMEDDLILKNGR
jgi:hypothetical protein